jgi:hypothetical protein
LVIDMTCRLNLRKNFITGTTIQYNAALLWTMPT